MKSDPLEIAKQLRDASKSVFPDKKVMLRAADLLEQLHDECASAWDMLDELKKSDVKNFDNVFKAMKVERFTKKNLESYQKSRKKNGTD
jgi:hypothetical protein